MSRINYLGIILILVVVVAVGCSTTQKKPHPLWDKTVTLSSGEVVLDMNGEWARNSFGYGTFSWYDGGRDTLTLKQDGNMFVAIRQVASRWVPAGAETFKGELNKDGFKVVSAYIGSEAVDGTFVWEECMWEISERGNKVKLECGERIRPRNTSRWHQSLCQEKDGHENQ